MLSPKKNEGGANSVPITALNTKNIYIVLF